ncbi:MAG: hypothetical protein AABZ55_01230, partial [Bdellovibrionota bacterium]
MKPTIFWNFNLPVLSLILISFLEMAGASPRLTSHCIAERLASDPTAIDISKAQAQAAGLIYIKPEGPGLTRVMETKKGLDKKGKEVEIKIPHYFDLKGNEITHEAEIKRLNGLHIPPGYDDKSVWISPDPKSHIQATALDPKGGKQYRYHPDWESTRSKSKFKRVTLFGEVLSDVRKDVNQNLAKKGVTKEKVLAVVTRLLDRSRIRIGNEVYAEENGTFGLTTLRKDQATVEGDLIHFDFIGKT